MAKHDNVVTTTSEAELEQSFLIVIYGGSKFGKTWSALTASKYWPQEPEKRTSKSKEIVLEDTIHIGHDYDAPIGLRPHNINVKYFINMPKLISTCNNNYLKAFRVLSAKVQEILAKDSGISVIVHDTMSFADMASLAYYRSPKRCPMVTNRKTGEEMIDERQVFYRHLGWHHTYFTEMTQIPTGIVSVFLFHEMTLEEPNAATMSDKQMADIRARQGGDVSVNVVPKVTGSAWRLYYEACTIELPLIATPIKGKDNQWDRNFWTVPYAGRRTKNRFQHLLDKKEPADLRLLLSKIEKGM